MREKTDDGAYKDDPFMLMLDLIRQMRADVLRHEKEQKQLDQEVKQNAIKAENAIAETKQIAIEAKNTSDSAKKDAETSANGGYQHLIPWLKDVGITPVKDDADKDSGHTGHIYVKCNELAREMGYDVDVFPRRRLGKSGFLSTMYPPKVLNRFRDRILSRPEWHRWFKIASWIMDVPAPTENVSVRHDMVAAIGVAKFLISSALSKGPQESSRILAMMDKRGIPNLIWKEAKSQLGVIVKCHRNENGAPLRIWYLP